MHVLKRRLLSASAIDRPASDRSPSPPPYCPVQSHLGLLFLRVHRNNPSPVHQVVQLFRTCLVLPSFFVAVHFIRWSPLCLDRRLAARQTGQWAASFLPESPEPIDDAAAASAAPWSICKRPFDRSWIRLKAYGSINDASFSFYRVLPGFSGLLLLVHLFIQALLARFYVSHSLFIAFNPVSYTKMLIGTEFMRFSRPYRVASSFYRVFSWFTGFSLVLRVGSFLGSYWFCWGFLRVCPFFYSFPSGPIKRTAHNRPAVGGAVKRRIGTRFLSFNENRRCWAHVASFCFVLSGFVFATTLLPFLLRPFSPWPPHRFFDFTAKNHNFPSVVRQLPSKAENPANIPKATRWSRVKNEWEIGREANLSRISSGSGFTFREVDPKTRRTWLDKKKHHGTELISVDWENETWTWMKAVSESKSQIHNCGTAKSAQHKKDHMAEGPFFQSSRRNSVKRSYR